MVAAQSFPAGFRQLVPWYFFAMIACGASCRQNWDAWCSSVCCCWCCYWTGLHKAWTAVFLVACPCSSALMCPTRPPHKCCSLLCCLMGLMRRRIRLMWSIACHAKGANIAWACLHCRPGKAFRSQLSFCFCQSMVLILFSAIRRDKQNLAVSSVICCAEGHCDSRWLQRCYRTGFRARETCCASWLLRGTS